jgi:SAM-dependent methyltransferase
MKRLASVDEMNSPAFSEAMNEINEIGRRGDMRVIHATSRLWEYPFCRAVIQRHAPAGARILDIGSERSPFPFHLSGKGYRVTITDIEKKWREDWDRASRVLSVRLDQAICPAERLPFPDATFDVYLSVSVIEHTRFKEETILEAARVLKPGGLLLLTFDIYEEERGMVYPSEFGSALSMHQFDALFEKMPCFRPLDRALSWNVEAIPGFLKWHYSTKPIHRYVVGAAAFRRSGHHLKPQATMDALRLDMKMLYTYKIAAPFRRMRSRVHERVLRRVRMIKP